MEKTKIFVSTNLGYVQDDIKEIVEAKFGESYEFVTTYENADIVIFANEWNENSVCISHHIYCENHKITIWEI